jgi:hypothetical protein
MALITADCWSYFVASFSKNAPTQWIERMQ